MMYESGRFVNRDTDEAIKLYRIAANSGDLTAIELLYGRNVNFKYSKE